MTRWKQTERYFDMEVSNDGREGHSVRVPKPIYERLDNPKKIAFVIGDDCIEVVKA